MAELILNKDRMLPSDPAAKRIARRLYSAVADAPIISPHGHVDPELFVSNKPFSDPTELFILPDHYVTRLLHGQGVNLEKLRRSDPNTNRREAWRLFSSHWKHMLGTPVRYWMEDQLSSVFGIRDQPSEHNADALFDELSHKLTTPHFLPRTLLASFNISVLATTDDPADSLTDHQTLATDREMKTRVLPTFRADRYFDPSAASWVGDLSRLSLVSDTDTASYEGLIIALSFHRDRFRAMGCTSTDTGVVDAWAEPLDASEAERIHKVGLLGQVSPNDAARYRHNMVYRMAEMSAHDGLVMQLHAGVLRNHHTATLRNFGPDTGHDLPLTTEFTRPLRRLLNDFGTNPNFRIVLFTVDETTFSRELAPLAGFYPSVFVGAPWWFLDTPDAMRRFRESVTDSAGFYKTSGFIDDTRALCSIPARHDLSRRIDAGHLATLVSRHQISEDDALMVARDLVDAIPTETFRLNGTNNSDREDHVMTGGEGELSRPE